jgi:hypothetical protein
VSDSAHWLEVFQDDFSELFRLDRLHQVLVDLEALVRLVLLAGIFVDGCNDHDFRRRIRFLRLEGETMEKPGVETICWASARPTRSSSAKSTIGRGSAGSGTSFMAG